MQRKARPSKDEYYLGIAKAVCQRSPCIRRQFGAIVVKDDVVVSTGYNGPARGVVNCEEVGCLKDELKIPHYTGYDWCLPPDEEVLTEDGYKPIAKISVSDSVLTHEGRFDRVKRVFKRNAAGLLRIKPWGLLPVRLTADHPVLAIKRRECEYSSEIPCKEACSWAKNSHCSEYYKEYRLEWVPAKFLRKDDIVVLPFDDARERPKTIDLSFIADSPSIHQRVMDALEREKSYDWVEENLDVYPSTAFGLYNGPAPLGHTVVVGNMLRYGHSPAKPVPVEIDLKEDILQTFGFYLAEGCTNEDQVIFTFGGREKAYAETVRGAMLMAFGVDAYEDAEESRIHLKFSSIILKKFFETQFGGNRYEKRIPKTLMRLPPDLQRWILDGYARGEGHFEKNGEIRVATASRTLALQLTQILLRLRIVPFVDMCLNNHGARIYRLTWREKWSNGRGYIRENFLFVPIEEIRREKYNGPVYNLEVAGGNSYTTKSFAVHNCTGVHAEENCVINAARHGASVLGGTLYLYGKNFGNDAPIEGRPCDRCKRAIINAGIKEVVTMNSEGRIIRFNVAEWVKEDTENYIKRLKEARQGRKTKKD